MTFTVQLQDRFVMRVGDAVQRHIDSGEPMDGWVVAIDGYSVEVEWRGAACVMRYPKCVFRVSYTQQCWVVEEP